jgi:hypothetical protein
MLGTAKEQDLTSGAAKPFEAFSRTLSFWACDFGPITADVHFAGKVDGFAYPSLSPTQQDAFLSGLCDELERLQSWCATEGWLPDAFPALQIFVSDEYRISRALIPASVGQRGRMELPAWKIVAGEAAIAHELAHIYFPNGNRFLAEGLAVYLQAKIGGNPAFPNFGRPLDELAIETLRRMLPEFAEGDDTSLGKIHLTALDRIATPSGLRMRVGLRLFQVDDGGHAHIYPLVGSFVAYAIERHGLERFRVLYGHTPLRPFERDAGPTDRWAEVYGMTLEDIEQGWKTELAALAGRLCA